MGLQRTGPVRAFRIRLSPSIVEVDEKIRLMKVVCDGVVVIDLQAHMSLNSVKLTAAVPWCWFPLRLHAVGVQGCACMCRGRGVCWLCLFHVDH